MIKLFHCADCNFVVEDFSGKKTVNEVSKQFPNHKLKEQGLIEVGVHRYKVIEDGKGKFKMEIRDATVDIAAEKKQVDDAQKIQDEIKRIAIKNLKDRGEL